MMFDQVAVPTGRHYTWWQAWWKSLTRPTPGTFSQLLADPAMSLRRAFRWIAVVAIVAAVLDPLGRAGPRDFARLSDWMMFTLSGSVMTLVAILVLPLIVTGLVQVATKALGGSSARASLFYAFAAFCAPLLLCASAAVALVLVILSTPSGQTPGIIDFVYEHKDVLRLILFVYGLIGLASASRAVYGLTWGRTLIAAWAPVIGGLLLFYGCAALAVLAVMMGAFG